MLVRLKVILGIFDVEGLGRFRRSLGRFGDRAKLHTLRAINWLELQPVEPPSERSAAFLFGPRGYAEIPGSHGNFVDFLEELEVLAVDAV